MLGNSSTIRDGSVEAAERSLLALTAICIISVSAWVALTPPARGYETMYGAYPTAFWTLLSLGLMAPAVVFLLSAFRRDGYWKVALILVCVVYVLYNLLPLFRGWAMYGRNMADVLAHIGYSRPVFETNRLLTDDFYPVVHIFIVELRLLGVPIRAVSPLMSAVFAPLYFFGVYLLSRELTQNKWVGVTTLACAIVPLFAKFHHTYHPNFFSFVLLPLFLFVGFRFLRNRNRSFLVLFVAFTSLLVIFHPVTPIYAGVAFGVTLGVQILYEYSDKKTLSFDREMLTGYGTIFSLLSILWLLWYGRFPIIQDFLNDSLDLGGGSERSVAQDYGVQQIEQGQSLLQLLIGFVDSYGPIFLVCGIAAIAALWVVVRLVRRKATYSEMWFVAQFSVGVVMSVVMMVEYVIAFDPVRNSRYMILMATLLAGLFIFHLLQRDASNRLRYRRTLAISLIALLLLAAIPVGVTNSYHPRSHMTFAEKDGTSWFYDNWSPDSEAVSHQTSYKMRMYLQGGSYQEYYNTSKFDDISRESPIPQYLGYRQNDTLRETVNGNKTYLVTKEYDTEYYYTIKEFAREPFIVYDDSSLDRLESDRTVDKVYANGGYTVWFVNGTPTRPTPITGTGLELHRRGDQYYNRA